MKKYWIYTYIYTYHTLIYACIYTVMCAFVCQHLFIQNRRWICLYSRIYILPCYKVMSRAMEIASKSGAVDVTSLASACAENVHAAKLAMYENVTSSLLKPSSTAENSLPKSKIIVQKAMVMTFQTWAMRQPKHIRLVGLLLAQSKKKGQHTVIQVIVDSVLKNVVSSREVNHVIESQDLKMVGAIFVAQADDEKAREDGKTWCKQFLGPDVTTTLCILAPWTTLCACSRLYQFIYI